MPAGLRNEKEEREVVAEKGENDFEVNIQSMNSDSHAPNDLSINDFLSFFIFFLVISFSCRICGLQQNQMVDLFGKCWQMNKNNMVLSL